MGGQLKIGNVILGRCGGASVVAITLSGGGVASGRGLLMAREEQALAQRQAQHSTQASSRTRILRLLRGTAKLSTWHRQTDRQAGRQLGSSGEDYVVVCGTRELSFCVSV